MKHVYDKIPKMTEKAESIPITNCQNNPNKPTKLEQAIAMSLIFLIPLLFIGRNTKYGRIISSKIFGNKNSFQTFGSNVTFNDVKGCDEAKYELEQTVEFLKNPLKHIPIDNPVQRKNTSRTFCTNAISYDCLALTKSTLRLHINWDGF